MIPMKAAMDNGLCCFKCIYMTDNEDPGLPWYCLAWNQPFMGAAGRVCGRFRLDTTRFVTLERPVGTVQDGPQRTLYEWGVERCSG